MVNRRRSTNNSNNNDTNSSLHIVQDEYLPKKKRLISKAVIKFAFASGSLMCLFHIWMKGNYNPPSNFFSSLDGSNLISLYTQTDGFGPVIPQLAKEWPTQLNVTKLDADPRPLLVMNVGIPKTGSTTLQHYLEIDNQNGILEKSNYTFFTCATETDSEQIVLLDIWERKGRDRKNWNTFNDCFEKARATGKNAIYSYEIFGKLLTDDDEHMENLKYFLKDWKVVIVVTYRRLFDWLPSYLFQNYRLFTKWSFGNGVYRPRPFPSFVEYCRTRGFIYSRDWGHVLDDVHPTEATLKQFENYFDNMVIFNMHESNLDGHNIVSYFYCKFLPHADEACKFRLNEGLDESKNVGTTFNYDLLAEAAHNEGFVDRKLRKGMIIKTIREHQENDLKLKHYDFPLLCPSPAMEDWLLRLSLEFERRILPIWFMSERGERDHREQFDIALGKKRFCTIDESEAIQNVHWKEFLLNSRVGNKN